ncbi:ribosomal RNA-processing protein 7-like [Teratosphaeria destructans]|uniref:Ribosomal RNA-processing protein 7-like n=1 Tax=Teratosphaeria destructans TaxID=418781 RepID=A0A9W7W391_9PEZI|nr:ribosomal RNA-processing protein 7-like [Teratosphaeria destructans]
MPQAKATTAVATTVNDFTVLPLRLPPTSAYPHPAPHYLYLRPHAPKVPTDDTPRQVFLVNVPVDATETHVRSLFAHHLGGARIDRVALEGARVGRGITAPVAPSKRSKKRKRAETEGATAGAEVGLLPEVWDRELHRSGGTAVVTFVDEASASLAVQEAKKAVKAGKAGTTITWGAGVEDQVPALGSARYLAHQRLRYPDPLALQKSVDDYMAAFAVVEMARDKARAVQRSVPDADGFITVTRGGRAGPARAEEAKAKEEELKRRERERVKADFYRFQVREKRKEQAQDLVKGFEEDRRRLEDMRRRRGKVRPE